MAAGRAEFSGASGPSAVAQQEARVLLSSSLPARLFAAHQILTAALPAEVQKRQEARPGPMAVPTGPSRLRESSGLRQTLLSQVTSKRMATLPHNPYRPILFNREVWR